MKTILFESHFVRALSVAFAILVTSGSRDNYLSDQNNFYVAAFCSNSNNIRRLISRRSSSIPADRGNSIGEWVSYLEEEFNRSSDDGDNTNTNNRNENALHPAPKQRPFQTPVKSHASVIDFLDQIETAPPNYLTVVLYFAHYCKTCHRAIIPFKQLANDSTPDVRFFRVETSALSPKQFLSLGIDRIPFLQIYRNGICVASFSATQKINRTSRKIVLRPRVAEHIDACQRRSLSDWSIFRDRHDMEIEANKAARSKIRKDFCSRSSDGRNAMNNYDGDDEGERLYRSVQTLTSESEWLRLIHGSGYIGKKIGSDAFRKEGHEEENGIVVIMFHSHFDQSCLRAQHKFRKIAKERQQQQNQGHKVASSFTMARIEASVLSDKTFQLLGIQHYPHIQIYRNSNRPYENEGNTETKECVASFSIPRSFLFSRMLHESLDAIDQRTLDEWTEFYNQHREDIEIQQMALEGIVREREQQQQQQQ